jgi:hypothetical protein
MLGPKAIKLATFAMSMKGKTLADLDEGIVTKALNLLGVNKPELIPPIVALARADNQDGDLFAWVQNKVSNGGLDALLGAPPPKVAVGAPEFRMARCPHCDLPIVLDHGEPHDAEVERVA